MYGKGVIGNSKEENIALKMPFIKDRKLLQDRALKAFEVAQNLPYVNPEKIAILGFGFGGICALDLARSGVKLLGTISIYGHFSPPNPSLIKPIDSKVLVLHGYNDPVTPQSELHDFEKEMTDANVDWQVHSYGNTMHAFATPGANDPAAGILYNPLMANRAWKTVHNFLDEIFSID